MNYTEANALLQGRCKDSRKIGNNTYLLRRNEHDIVIRLHKTDIVMFKPNGDIVLDSDGWRTVTTKQRMNEYSPRGDAHYRVWSDRGTWKLSIGGNSVLDWETQTPNPAYREYRFEDGFTIHSDGSTDGELFTANGKADKLKKQVSRFVAGYIAAMESGKVGAPGMGDCFYCQMREVNTHRPLGELTDSDHIKSHMSERYYVPSLLARAMEVFPTSQVMKWWVGSFWDTAADEATRVSARQAGGDFAKQKVTKVLRRYILRQLGYQA